LTLRACRCSCCSSIPSLSHSATLPAQQTCRCWLEWLRLPRWLLTLLLLLLLFAAGTNACSTAGPASAAGCCGAWALLLLPALWQKSLPCLTIWLLLEQLLLMLIRLLFYRVQVLVLLQHA
jgi:hypothetical protein